MSTDEAVQLLKATAYFRDANDSLLRVLASHMARTDADDGHVFLEEGDEIRSVIILEEGTLTRTKLAVDEQDLPTRRASMRDLSSTERVSSRIASSVLLHYISGRGQVTGLLHNFKQGNTAYATVSAHGPVKAWLISGEDLRSIITSKPEYSLDIMASLSRELRVGTKSLRALVRQSKGGHRKGDERQSEAKVCRVFCYDATSWVTEGFKPAVEEFNKRFEKEGYSIEMEFTTERLSQNTAIFAAGYNAVCLFVNDEASGSILQTLSLMGVRMIAMRCAGFDRVDTKAARAFGMTVARVPAYSPYAVAEMAVALLMAVNRKINKASNRVRMANFTLDSGLMGMDIHGKTVGVMGTGRIGQILCKIMLGFGVKLLCHDVHENEDVIKAGGLYVDKETIFQQSDILFLMMPLLPATQHTINMDMLPKLKKGVILINTSRGGLVDTKALLKGLQDEIIAGVGMDVYEHEQEYFFQDWSGRNVKDTDLVALLGNNQVVLTAHQAFFTKEAVDKIVSTTIDNLHDFYHKGLSGQSHPNNCIPPLPKE